MNYIEYTVDLVIFARFIFLRIPRGRQTCEFKNLAKIIIIIVALLKKNEMKWNSKFHEKSQKSEIRENVNKRKLPDLQ